MNRSASPDAISNQGVAKMSAPKTKGWLLADVAFVLNKGAGRSDLSYLDSPQLPHIVWPPAQTPQLAA